MRCKNFFVVAGTALSVAFPATLSAQFRAQFRDARQEPIQWSLSATNSMATYTAAHNEPIDGAFRTLSVQVAKPVFRWRGTSVAWLGEVLPAIHVTSEAPPSRLPLAGIDPAANDPVVMARYGRGSGYGFGLAPLGAELAHATGARGRIILNVTSGGAWFTRVVPYGRATQANFTVAPGLLYAHRVGPGSLAVGYVMHHLSNASMGGANPGMNSHLVTLRWTR
jgi:hypothetical protein